MAKGLLPDFIPMRRGGRSTVLKDETS